MSGSMLEEEVAETLMFRCLNLLFSKSDNNACNRMFSENLIQARIIRYFKAFLAQKDAYENKRKRVHRESDAEGSYGSDD